MNQIVQADSVIAYAEILNSPPQALLLLGYVEYTGVVMPKEYVLLEDWDSVTPPALTGWTVTDVTGSTGDWVSYVNSPLAGMPSGVNGATFNSQTATATHSTRLWKSATIDMTATKSSYLAFWFYHTSANSGKNDTIQVQTSSDSTNWTNRGAAIPRYLAANTGWVLHLIDLTAEAANAAMYVGFLGTGAGASTQTFIDTVFLVSINNTQADFVLGYVEVSVGVAQVVNLLGYVETGNGSTSEVTFGPRWQ